jgi:hypothetical protein
VFRQQSQRIDEIDIAKVVRLHSINRKSPIHNSGGRIEPGKNSKYADKSTRNPLLPAMGS